MRWTRVLRVVLGFLLAPIPVTLFFGMVALSFLASFGRHENAEALLMEVPLWSYGITFVFGLPIHLGLQWWQKPGLAHYVLVGLVASVMLSIFPFGFEYGLISFLSGFMFTSFFVLMTVVLFWLIAVWQPRKTIEALRAAFQRRRPSHG